MQMRNSCSLSSVVMVILLIGAWTPLYGEGMPLEERVVLDGGIVGIVARPEGATNVPAVLMLHGFGSHKDEVGDLFKRLSGPLARNGIASLRIDFPGWGESAGEMWESSLSVRVAATDSAYRYLRTMPFADQERIGVVGFSMGGTTARISAALDPDRYKSMVAWASASNGGSLELTPEEREILERDGRVTIDLGWREVTLGSQWFEDSKRYRGRHLELIAQYPGAFLSIGGDEDPAAADLMAFVNAAGGKLKEGMIIGGAGHIFEVLTEDQSKAERVLAKTIDWFRKSL